MGHLYILLGLGATTALAFCYNATERRNGHRQYMAVAMGVGALLLSALTAVAQRVDLRAGGPSQYLIGALMGLSFAASLPMFLAAVRRGDLSISWSILTMGFAVVSLLCLAYPGERITPLGWCGLACSAVAIGLLGIDARRSQQAHGQARHAGRGWGLFMTLAFVANLGILYSYRLAAHFRPDDSPAHNAAFLVTGFAVLGAGSLLVARLWPREGRLRPAIGAGLAGGACLWLGGSASLLAMGKAGVPGAIWFPITVGGSSVLVAVLSVAFLKERPGRLGWLGIAVGTVGLALLGVSQG